MAVAGGKNGLIRFKRMATGDKTQSLDVFGLVVDREGQQFRDKGVGNPGIKASGIPAFAKSSV